MSTLFTEVMDIHDPAYHVRRQEMSQTLLRNMTDRQIEQQFDYLLTATDHANRDDERTMSRKMLNELYTNPTIPETFKNGFASIVQKGILDSTAGAPLVRQDLEVQLYSLFVRKFPLFDRLKKAQSNGLVS